MPSKKNSSAKSAPKATHADAEIVLRLFEQRREPELRKARNYVLFEFAPRTNEEFLAVITNFGTPEQTHCRMVFGYWDQSAALVTHGAVHADLFDDFSTELCFLYAKYKDFIPALRANLNPEALQHVEKVANRSQKNRERVQRFQRIIAERFKPRAAKTGS